MKSVHLESAIDTIDRVLADVEKTGSPHRERRPVSSIFSGDEIVLADGSTRLIENVEIFPAGYRVSLLGGGMAFVPANLGISLEVTW